MSTPEECDYAYLHVWPQQNNIVFAQRSMPVLELVEGFMHEEREVNKSQKKTGNLIGINTLRGVGKIPVLAETVHAHGGKVIAITEREIDGVIRAICASPNDVPGNDKDQYIGPAILSKVKSGNYAYCDADGNYYRSGFGLRYE